MQIKSPLQLTTIFAVLRLLPRRELFFVVLVSSIRTLLVALDLIGIVLIGAVVSLVTGTLVSETSQFGQLLASVENLGFSNSSLAVLTLAVVFFILKGIFSIVLISGTAKYLARLELKMSKQLFSRILEMPLEFLERYSTQELIFIGTQSISAATTRAILISSSLLAEATLLVSVSFYLAYVDFVMFVSIGAFFTFVGLLMNSVVTKASAHSSTEIQESNLATQGLMLDSLAAFRQIATSPSWHTIAGQYSDLRRTNSSQRAKYQLVNSLPRYITEIAVIIGIILLISQRANEQLVSSSAAVVAVFLAGIFRIVSSMITLQASMSSWKDIEIESQASLAFLNEISLLEPLPNKDFEIFGPADIEVNDLSYKYSGTEKPVLRNLSFSIKAGQFAAIVGGSGKGKSTLADLIMGLRIPTQGNILVNGIESRAVVYGRRGHLSYVPQNPAVLSGTLRQNISLNFETAIEGEEAKVTKALAMAGLEHFLRDLPSGLETKFGEEGQGISGGEKQRIALARALFESPSVLVLDEPTSALDKKTQLEISETLKNLRGHVTLIVIAHRSETIHGADLVIRL